MNYDEYNDFDELNNYGHSENRYLTYEEVEKVAASKVRGSILWMVLGLLISGLTGYFTLIGLSNGTVPFLIVPIAFILEFVAVITFTALTYKASASVLKMIFLVYSVLTGITLSAIGAIYDPYAIITAFTGTIVLFTVLAIYGYVTKEDLSKYRSILMVGLIALIVMGGINFFIQSDGLMWISSMLGVAVFIVFIAYDVNRIKNNVVNEAKNILYAASKLPIIGSNARDLHALLQEAEIEQINKELEAQEEEQDKKTFYDKISNMELDESTVSNRVGAIDDSAKKSIYNNFNEGKLKVGMEITIGSGNGKEKLKILEIMDKTKSGIRGIAVGNMKTGKVEIILEGSMPPNEFFKNPTKVTKHWANNISGNMRRSSLGLLKGATSLNLPNFSDVYRSNENGTPLDYQEALEFSKKIQNEYKNGKDGFKGLVRVSGHSKAGGASIYIASHLNIEAIAVDPAPVNNPGRYLYNNKILKVIPDNEGDFINGALLNEVKTNSKGEKISSSRTFGLQKAVENINIKVPIDKKLENVKQVIKGSKIDNLATMVVKAKEGSLWHTTDIGDVIEKEKTLLNEIKLYKSNKNRGR